jgi:hypothetical protein
MFAVLEQLANRLYPADPHPVGVQKLKLLIFICAMVIAACAAVVLLMVAIYRT